LQAKINPLLDGITFSGGEPFEQAGAFAMLAQEAKKLGLNIMTYTGYTYEYLLENSLIHKDWTELLEESDILVDGRFELEKKNLLLKFRGSENQRIIDLKKTRLNGNIVLAAI
jgi:anaerobic ribonucleoside-triphosphate reductase activating protein